MSTRALRTRILGVVGAVLLIAGVIAIVVAVRAQKSAPQPPPAAASPVSVIPTGTSSKPTGAGSSTASSSSRVRGPKTRGSILDRSVPTRLQIPAIKVDSRLRKSGLNSKGEIATPPLDKDSHAYWLNVSPTPGQLGPSTIIGHVDSAAYGPGVFFRLGGMRQRDKITVTRSDGVVATFEVERVAEYKKADFPTHEVYGNIDHAGLRLITCGGTFDPSIHSYESNIVVYAALVSSHRA